MANIDIYMQKLTDIANAIRNKLGEQNTYTLEQMPGKIASIPTGSTSVIISKTINDNGTYNASSDNADGYSPVIVNLPLGSKSITSNGNYNASSDSLKGYSSVAVNVSPNVSSKSVTANGTYTASSENLDGYSSVNVNVSPNVGTKNITANGTYYASSDSLDGYSSVDVNIQSQDTPCSLLLPGFTIITINPTEVT